MHRLKRLNPAKNMTDDDLLNEFRLAQSMARRRGQHLPLTVTRSDPKNPTMHRPTVERNLDMFRREANQEEPTPSQRVAQNTASDVAKGIGRANSIHGGVKSFLDGIGAMLNIKSMAEQHALENARTQGRLGGSVEDFQRVHGNDPELKKAFMEGYRENMQRKKNRR